MTPRCAHTSVAASCRGLTGLFCAGVLAFVVVACGQVEPLDDEGEEPSDGSPGRLVDAVSSSTDATATGLWSLPAQGCGDRSDGAPCEDGDPCSQDDQCKTGACVAGKSVCECSTAAQCAAYEDGNLCNGTLYCDTKAFPYRCRIDPQSIVQCSGKGGPCVDLVCTPSTGACLNKPRAEGSACDDGDACTVVSVCQKGKCTGEMASWCQCQGDSDCAGVGSGNPCDGSYFCDKSLFPYACKVAPASVVSCSKVSNTVCSKSACDPATGKCAKMAVEKLKEVCPVNLPCRWSLPAKGAVGKSVPCDDGNACTQGDAEAGLCPANRSLGPHRLWQGRRLRQDLVDRLSRRQDLYARCL